MADTRSVDDLAQTIADMQAQIDDLKSTTDVRVVIRPTGTLEPTVRTVAPTGALMCNGQAISRVTYAALFQFAQDQSILGGSNPVFGVGDGSTTFTLPDVTGRVLVGAGTLSGDTYTLGVNTGNAHPTLTTAQVPPHLHHVTTAHSAGHTHAFTSTGNTGHYHNVFQNIGGHGGHFPGTQHLVPSGSTIGVPAWNDGGSGVGDHNHGSTDVENGHDHSGTTGNDGVYSHVMNETALPAAGTIDTRQPSLPVNCMIWT